MTTTALVTMIIVWTVVIFFMLRFLIKVLRMPFHKQEVKEEENVTTDR